MSLAFMWHINHAGLSDTESTLVPAGLGIGGGWIWRQPGKFWACVIPASFRTGKLISSVFRRSWIGTNWVTKRLAIFQDMEVLLGISEQRHGLILWASPVCITCSWRQWLSPSPHSWCALTHSSLQLLYVVKTLVILHLQGRKGRDRVE